MCKTKIMKKFTFYLSMIAVFLLVNSMSLLAQQKDLDKIRNYIQKGKLDKAQEHCDKVTDALAYDKAVRFFNVMANGYYHHKDYEKASELAIKGNDKKLAAKLAKEFEDKKNDFFDINIAAKLYHKAQENEKAAGLFFGEGRYEEAAAACNTPACNKKYGDSLLNNGKFQESLLFYKQAKSKGQLFDNEKVLEYYYSKKDYVEVYRIQDFNEGDFKMHIQGSVIDKMFENNESLSFVKHFLDSLGIRNNKQDEVIIEAYVNAKQFENAENYCLNMKQPNQQIALSFLADKASPKYPEVSAFANIKLGRNMIAFNQLGTYLINTAASNNDGWESSPIGKKLLTNFKDKTKPAIQKCGKDYCEMVKHATALCKVKADELSGTNAKEAEFMNRTREFLNEVSISFCK